MLQQIGKEASFTNSESQSVVNNSLQVKNINDYSQQVHSNQGLAKSDKKIEFEAELVEEIGGCDVEKLLNKKSVKTVCGVGDIEFVSCHTVKEKVQHANHSLSSELGTIARHHVAGRGKTELMELWLLIWAANHVQQDALKVLLKHKIDPTIETKEDDGDELQLLFIFVVGWPLLAIWGYAKWKREIQALEWQYAISNLQATSINELIKLSGQIYEIGAFKEVQKFATELGPKLEKLDTQMTYDVKLDETTRPWALKQMILVGKGLEVNHEEFDDKTQL
ncbi:hypothetical protein L1987_01844 [Smallanthus sonchifolius]|uniref:Uncharacterized protein n=1 Tax=Smallanthus sonchifolius TaxID=185202 RepID=A0ACB9K629_9ASTR|nr:hypothetical protein L1987_01844 [Smallanthus sonchifolius]